MGKLPTYPLEILLIEGDSKKIGLVKKLLTSTNINYNIHVVFDKKESYAYLQKKGDYKNIKVPDAIIHNSSPTSSFEEKVNSFINSNVLFMKVTNDKIEITKSNKHIIDYKQNIHGIKHIMEAIVSVKKFMDSLVNVPEKDSQAKVNKHNNTKSNS